MYRLSLFFFALLLLTSCDKEIPVTTQTEFNGKQMHDFLALGDSYTIGESVPSAGNFPNQLAAQLLSKDGIEIGTPRIIAKTSWRTDELIKAIANAGDIRDSIFSVVTLCIGVNNQYQNIDFKAYETEFDALLHTALKFAGKKPDHIFVLSIPDWVYTKYGQNFTSDPSKISERIDLYNTYNRTLSLKNGVNYVDITPISRQGLKDPSMVATDGLHPSELQYARWVELLRVEVAKVLK